MINFIHLWDIFCCLRSLLFQTELTPTFYPLHTGQIKSSELI